jgi:hypothetical protein
MLWWMPLGNLKRKTHKVHMNEEQNKYFKNISLGRFYLKEKNKIHFKRCFENKVKL